MLMIAVGMLKLMTMIAVGMIKSMMTKMMVGMMMMMIRMVVVVVVVDERMIRADTYVAVWPYVPDPVIGPFHILINPYKNSRN